MRVHLDALQNCPWWLSQGFFFVSFYFAQLEIEDASITLLEFTLTMIDERTTVNFKRSKLKSKKIKQQTKKKPWL